MKRDEELHRFHPLAQSPEPRVSRRWVLALGAGAAGSALLARQEGTAAPSTAPVWRAAPAFAQQQGGMLQAAIYTEPPTVADGMLVSSAIVDNINRHIFESLFAPDSTFAPQPMLAESYVVSPDGSHYEFTLREGLKFHNGQDVTAADVVASLARWTQLSNKGKILGPRLAEDGLQAVDDRTVTVTFQGPTGVFLDFLAMPNSFIMPAEAAEAAGMEQIPEDQLIGTGPFRFEEHAVDRFTRLVRNEEYQPRTEPADGLAGERIVYLDDVQLMPVPDASVRASGILTGEYHFAEELEPDQYDMLESDPGVVALIRQPGSAMLAHFNKARGPFTDPRVRQAVALAINKEEAMISGFGREEFFRLDPSVAAPETPWHSSVGEEQFLQYDPEAAKALLAEA
ncbi:MAG: ABC transporter substrate-binding protein, partial [Thermomicrobiales bacterium]|nr:ABC transporter substrate-binding protein [Thermomicrobiales bacterium]